MRNKKVNEFEPLGDEQFFAYNQEAKLLLANPLLQKDIWHTINDLYRFFMKMRRIFDLL